MTSEFEEKEEISPFLEKQSFVQSGPRLVKSSPKFAHSDARVEVRLAKTILDVRSGLPDGQSRLFIQGSDLSLESFVQLDPFQAK